MTKWNLLGSLTVVLFIFIPTVVMAKVIPLADCAQLSQPKTILVVHVSWCPACKQFMPLYENLSNDKKYSDWTFYEKMDDNYAKVCGATIPDVPRVFVNNMQALTGTDDLADLKNFLDKN